MRGTIPFASTKWTPHMKQPKRACPLCGHAVQVSQSVTMNKTRDGSERYQKLKCTNCGLTGSASQHEVITWDIATLDNSVQPCKATEH